MLKKINFFLENKLSDVKCLATGTTNTGGLLITEKAFNNNANVVDADDLDRTIISSAKQLDTSMCSEWSYYSEGVESFGIDMEMVESENQEVEETQTQAADGTQTVRQALSFTSLYKGLSVKHARTATGVMESFKVLEDCCDLDDSGSDEGSKVVIDNFSRERVFRAFRKKNMGRPGF